RGSPSLSRCSRWPGERDLTTGSDLLDRDVDPGREVEALQRIDGLAGYLHDIDQSLVDPHLEVLTAVLVDVRRTDQRVLADLGRERHRTPDLRLGTQDGLDDLLRRLVNDLVVIGLEPNADRLPGLCCC